MPAPRSDPSQLRLEPGPDDNTTTPTTIHRDRPSLLHQLSIIDVEGWDGPAGTRLLQYLRAELVRPLTIHLGLRGSAASQAEATAWEAVWLEATNPSLRAADSPWGVLWRTARRAVLNEVVATRFASSPRQGWILAAAARRGQEHPPISLEALVAEGWETPSNELDADVALILADVFAEASEALIEVGWDAVAAERIVTALADLEPPRDPRSVALGWRSLATALDLPPWQARRLTIALRGTTQWQGVLPRLMVHGQAALGDPDVRNALVATRYRSHRSRLPKIVRSPGAATPISPRTRIVSALDVGSMIRASTSRLNISSPTTANPSRW